MRKLIRLEVLEEMNRVSGVSAGIFNEFEILIPTQVLRSSTMLNEQVGVRNAGLWSVVK